MFQREPNAVVFRQSRDEVGGIFDFSRRIRHGEIEVTFQIIYTVFDVGKGGGGGADEPYKSLLAEVRNDGMNLVAKGRFNFRLVGSNWKI